MYLIKRANSNHFSYAYEPGDKVKIINPPACQGTSYTKDSVCTVVTGRPRSMSRTKVDTVVYEIVNDRKDYRIRVAPFEIALETPLTPDEYKVLVTD